jgi:hypothetical protein
MSAIYSCTTEELGKQGDHTKTAVLTALVNEGLLNREVADVWNKTHEVICREVTWYDQVWRRLLGWSDKGIAYMVVKIVSPNVEAVYKAEKEKGFVKQ